MIVAGYEGPMQSFVQSNRGLPSRFARTIRFGSYSNDELVQIFHGMAEAEGLRLDRRGDARLHTYFAAARQRSDFGNARSARTLLERAREAQARRIGPQLGSDAVDLSAITPEDIAAAVAWSA